MALKWQVIQHVDLHSLKKSQMAGERAEVMPLHAYDNIK